MTGFDVDIAKALCAQMKAKCTIVAQDWDGIIPGLLAKKYDAIVASMSITEERMKKVAFTQPYYANYLQFVTKKGKKLETTKAGLKGKTIGAQRQTISSKYLEDTYKGIVRIKVYGTQQAAWLDLKSGRVDAVLADIYPGLRLAEKEPGLRVRRPEDRHQRQDRHRRAQERYGFARQADQGHRGDPRRRGPIRRSTPNISRSISTSNG